MSEKVLFRGVNFETLRVALFSIYFNEEEAENLRNENYRYIIPMSNSWESPLRKEEEEDVSGTYIQYWIERDEGINGDSYAYSEDKLHGFSSQQRVATVLLRYVGLHGELWAKILNHLIKRNDVDKKFAYFCNAKKLLYTLPITPTRVQFFGHNTSIAFDVRIKLHYNELIGLNWKPLEKINLIPKGTITSNKESK